MKLHDDSPVKGALWYVLFGLIFMCTAVLVGVYAGVDLDDSVIHPILVSAAVNGTEHKEPEVSPQADIGAKRLLMIDPGHGGEDGGASSESGLLEKDLNLALSEDIAHFSVLFGIPYMMTRDDDTLLYDYYSELTDYTGKKKSLDLKNRLKLTEESGSTLFLGIHMNKFTDARYSGLQVYYSPNDAESAPLANAVQSYVKTHLQNDNDRAAKAATSSIYLLSHIKIPALLVECGFLSNAAEAASLATPSYRAALAATVFSPVAEYFVRSNNS